MPSACADLVAQRRPCVHVRSPLACCAPACSARGGTDGEQEGRLCERKGLEGRGGEERRGEKRGGDGASAEEEKRRVRHISHGVSHNVGAKGDVAAIAMLH